MFFQSLLSQGPFFNICMKTGVITMAENSALIGQQIFIDLAESEADLMGIAAEPDEDSPQGSIKSIWRVDKKMIQAFRDTTFCACDDPDCPARTYKEKLVEDIERMEGEVIFITPTHPMVLMHGDRIIRKFVEYLNDGLDYDAAMLLLETEFKPASIAEILKAKGGGSKG